MLTDLGWGQSLAVCNEQGLLLLQCPEPQESQWICARVSVCACMPACSVSPSCLTLCDPMDSSPPGSSVHGILWARILEWVAVSSSRGSS